MVQYALGLNFGFLAITDHKFGGSSLCKDVISQCLAEKRLLCIPGQEVTGKVHLLAIGIQHEIDKRLSVKKQVEEIHKQGGLAIAAHPFRKGNAYTDEELFETGLDAVECRGIPAKKEKDFYAMLKEQNIPCVYNSDAHITLQLIRTWNTCDGEITSFDDLKKALKTGRCRKR
jgi:predicted metal-dependent phosphoesterase TrpH